MDEKTKQFAIRLLMVAVVILVVVVALYYLMSPYQLCMREGNGVWCFKETAW